MLSFVQIHEGPVPLCGFGCCCHCEYIVSQAGFVKIHEGPIPLCGFGCCCLQCVHGEYISAEIVSIVRSSVKDLFPLWMLLLSVLQSLSSGMVSVGEIH